MRRDLRVITQSVITLGRAVPGEKRTARRGGAGVAWGIINYYCWVDPL